MRISDWSSDVCSSDLRRYRGAEPISSAWKSPPLWRRPDHRAYPHPMIARAAGRWLLAYPTSSDAEQGYFRRQRIQTAPQPLRSEEHTSELQSLMRISYAVFFFNNTTLNRLFLNLIHYLLFRIHISH